MAVLLLVLPGCAQVPGPLAQVTQCRPEWWRLNKPRPVPPWVSRGWHLLWGAQLCLGAGSTATTPSSPLGAVCRWLSPCPSSTLQPRARPGPPFPPCSHLSSRERGAAGGVTGKRVSGTGTNQEEALCNINLFLLKQQSHDLASSL